MSECFFAHLSERPCDGPEDFAHLLKKSSLISELVYGHEIPHAEAKRMVWDEALWRRACRRHHGDFDNRVIRLPREQVPAETEEWAKRWGLTWRLDRDFGA